MYSRAPSIASIFQKAVLLKDTKCNKIMQRQLCSESLIKFSKIEKLKPMKRYYSGASNSRNPNQKTRYVQGVGYIRKSLPREMAHQQRTPWSMNEQMTSFRNRQGIANDLGIPLTGQYVNENVLNTSGKITIVLDKNEICGCAAPNEIIQIHITTTPEKTPTARPDFCRTKCNCCPQCRDVENSGIQNKFTKIPIETPFQQPSNLISFSNEFPMRHQNVNGLPFPRFERNMYGLSERRFRLPDGMGSPLNLTKSRSMSDFPAVRKFILPNTINGTQPQAHQRKSVAVDRTRFSNRVNASGRFDFNQPRTIGPNLIPMRRSFSFHSQRNRNGTQKSNPQIQHVNPLHVQHIGSSGVVVPRANHEHIKSHTHPADNLTKDKYTKLMDELRRQERKYSSFHHNVVPPVVPVNVPQKKPDAMQNKQPRDKVEIGRSGVPASKSKFIVERVIIPAQFASLARVSRNIAKALKQIVLNQKIKQKPHGPNTAPSSNVPFIGRLNRFNLHQDVATKNRFPAIKATSQPRTFAFKNRSGTRRFHQVDMSPGQMVNISRNVVSRNVCPLQPLSIPSKRRVKASASQGCSLINWNMGNLKQFPPKTHPQLLIPKNATHISFDHQNHQIKRPQPPNVYYRQNSQLHHGLTAPMRAKHMNYMGQTKQPPLLLLKKRAPAMTVGRRKYRPLQKHSLSFTPLLQSGGLQSNVTSKQYSPQKERTQSVPKAKPPQTSMIPVRSRVSPQNTPSLRCMPMHPFRNIPTMAGTKLLNPIEHQRLKQNPTRRVRRGPLKSFIPVVVPKQTYQIEKLGGKLNTVETAGQSYSNQRLNRLRLQQMPPQATVPMPQEPACKSNVKFNNPAVLFYAPGKLQLVDIPVPRLTDESDVIVKMLYVHLTDTDAQMLAAEQDGPYKLSEPTIAGKSGSGVIVAAGKNVESVKIGDKVSVKGCSCGKCTACQNDNEVICERVPITGKLGLLKRLHAAPAKFVTKLPDSVHPIDGAMMDELSSAIRACKKSSVTAGDNVLVLGGKSLGLWTALAAKNMGATDVSLADSRPLVLEQAKKLGIERVILIDPKSTIPHIVDSIAESMEGGKPRVVFDCNGSSLANYVAINTSVVGGKVVLMKNAIVEPIFLANAVDRGVDILSSQHGNNDSERAALQFLSSGKVQLRGIDSSFFKITNVREAFDLLNSGTTANIFVQPSRPNYESDGKK